MPGLHLPRCRRINWSTIFSCDLGGIVGGYGLRCLCLHLRASCHFLYWYYGAGRGKSVMRLLGDCTEIVQFQCSCRAVCSEIYNLQAAFVRICPSLPSRANTRDGTTLVDNINKNIVARSLLRCPPNRTSILPFLGDAPPPPGVLFWIFKFSRAKTKMCSLPPLLSDIFGRRDF